MYSNDFLLRHNTEVLALAEMRGTYSASKQLSNDSLKESHQDNFSMNHLLVMLYKFLSSPDMKIPDSVVDLFLSKQR